jgi:hypothetical protein
LAELWSQSSVEDFTDITLVATVPEDHGEIRAHRVVLAATSVYFRGLFGGNFQEREFARLDVSLRTLQAILSDFLLLLEE